MITFSWNAVPNATAYSVAWAPTLTGSKQILAASQAATSYSFDGSHVDDPYYANHDSYMFVRALDGTTYAASDWASTVLQMREVSISGENVTSTLVMGDYRVVIGTTVPAFTITPNEGHVLPPGGVTVVNNGVDITSQVYDENTHTISSFTVQGTVLIAANAVANPNVPVLTLSGSILSWVAIPDATKYVLTAVSDALSKTYTKEVSADTTSIDLTTWTDLTPSSWVISAVSYIGDIRSDESATVTYNNKIQLVAPTAINLTNGVLTWNNVANNSGYDIVYRRTDGSGDIYQVDIVDTNVTTHTLTVTAVGTYAVTIVTLGSGIYVDSEESATSTYTVAEKLATPTIAMNEDNVTLEITDVENATSYDIYVDSVYKASVAKSVPDVAKGDLLNIDLNGDGTTEQYRVVSIDGTNAQIVAMAAGTNMAFDSSSQVYANSPLDTYLNSTWYNTLSDTAKAAIVDKTFRQAYWLWDSSGSPAYSGYYGTTNPGTESYSISLGNASFGTEITRHVYVLSVQDIIDYVTDTNITDGKLQNYNIWKMLWNDTVSHSEFLWLRCASYGGSQIVFYVYGYTGSLDGIFCYSTFDVRPALTIDLSKIDYTK